MNSSNISIKESLSSKTINFHTFTKFNDWLESVAKSLACNVVDNCVKLPANWGKGEFRQYNIGDFLSVTYFKVYLNQPVELNVQVAPDASIVPVIFFLEDTQLFIEHKLHNVGMHTPKSICIPCQNFESKFHLPANKWVTNISLAFNKESGLQQFASPDSYIFQLLNQKKSFYIFESLTISMGQLIKELERDFDTTHGLQKLQIYNHSLQLFALVAEQLNDREKYNTDANINPNDLKTLFEIRKEILDKAPQTPSLQKLAEMAAMSTSKMRKIFKQVFGKSITQFALDEKMQLAKSLLNTRNHSVSEVAYKLGYSNVSHFARAFRNCHQINPGVYLESLIPFSNENDS